MNRLTRAFAILTVAASGLAPVAAWAASDSPAGTWQTQKGESRYELTMCGRGDALCGTLVWLRDNAPKSMHKDLNKQVVTEAKRVASRKWRGKVTISGRTFNGSLEWVDDNTIHVRGCEGGGTLCKGLDLERVSD